MTHLQRSAVVAAVGVLFSGFFVANHAAQTPQPAEDQIKIGPVTVNKAIRSDISPPLATLHASDAATDAADCKGAECGMSPGDPDAQADDKPAEAPPAPVIPPGGAAVEQTSQGQRPSAPLLDSFDGLALDSKVRAARQSFAILPTTVWLSVQTTSCRSSTRELRFTAKKALATRKPERCCTDQPQPARFLPASAASARHTITATESFAMTSWPGAGSLSCRS